MVEPLPAEALHWRCDPSTLTFDSTDDVEPIAGIVGQQSAVESLRFGLECDAPGQNVFVRGLSGTGRMTLVRRLLEELRPTCAERFDRCYVHNFAQPDKPRLISLEAGKARTFRRRVHELAEFVRDELVSALSANAVKARRESLESREKQEIEALMNPLEAEMRDASLALVPIQVGPVAQITIFPVVDNQPVPPEEYERLRAEGTVTDLQFEHYKERREAFAKRMSDTTDKVREIRRRYARAIAAVIQGTARAVLGDLARDILTQFPGEDVRSFLSEVIEDVVDNRLGGGDESDPTDVYGVNVLREHTPDDACPIIVENTPTLGNLLGTIDREWGPRGQSRSDYRMIRAGSLLMADGGYLILDAREILSEPGAWKVLLRTLKSGSLEIVPPELSFPMLSASIKPQPIPARVKVVLLGDSQIYYLLDRHDPDFSNLFKVLADFGTEITQAPDGVPQYAGVLARIAKEEKLLPFDRTAVAALAEHGARVAARRGKLTARFARIADIAREAAFLAKRADAKLVTGEHVHDAVQRTKRRADLPSRRFREYLADGTIQIDTSGDVVGQINGLAVIHAGPLTYGFPARITSSIGAGSAGIINIEGQAQLSGSIHTKGFHILGGLLRQLLQADHPLAFSASIAFEQSYGGIDGDSASGAEMCCLLSALTGIPIKQSFAMTGAIDQKGHIQAIGGVNEKIEGFFDTCEDLGLTGDQGVLIPHSNAGDLQLRQDVVDACAAGKFHVYAVKTIHEALEILTGVPAGELDEFGEYPEDTVLGEAVERAREFWLKAVYRPEVELVSEDEEDEDEEVEEPEESEPAADE